jgi:hypothetical protein
VSDTERVEIPRCTCSHSHVNHTRGTGKCWQAVCACREYRDPQRRIPEHLRTDDIQDYLRQKGETA